MFALLGAQLELLRSAYWFSMWLVFNSMMVGLPRKASWVLSVPRASTSKCPSRSIKTPYILALKIPEYHFRCILLPNKSLKSAQRKRNWTLSLNRTSNKEFVVILNRELKKNSRNENHSESCSDLALGSLAWRTMQVLWTRETNACLLGPWTGCWGYHLHHYRFVSGSGGFLCRNWETQWCLTWRHSCWVALQLRQTHDSGNGVDNGGLSKPKELG